MASNMSVFILLVYACTGITYVTAELCYSMESYYSYVDSDIKYRTQSTYCYSDQYCCSGTCCYSYSSGYYDYDYYYYSYTSYVISAGAIAGIVVGSLVGLGVLISIIVCLCCVCAKNRTQRPQGGQILTSPTAVFSVTTENVATQGSYPTQPTNPQSQPVTQTYPGGYNPAFTPDGQQGVVTNPMAAPPPSYSEFSKNN